VRCAARSRCASRQARPLRASITVAAVAVLAALACPAMAQDKAAPITAPPVDAVAPAAKIDTLRRIRDTQSIALGVRESSVPFSYLNAQKQPVGYSVDLCLRIADAVKAELRLPRLDVKFVPVTSSNRIPYVVDGRIDLECGSTTNTRKRQEQVAFAYTTFVAGIKLLARKSANVNGVEDLRGKSVVVTAGTTSESLLKTLNDERVLRIAFITAKDHGESFKAVEEGRAVAFAMDDVLLYGLISRSGTPDEFAVAGKFLSVEPYAIMLRRDDPQFERIVNNALNDLFQSGEIRRIYAKWFATKELTVPLNPYLRETFAAPNTYPAWP
jgi:glutamate/aspartate transport system substrate-binding protein